MEKSMLLPRRFAEWKMNFNVPGTNLNEFAIKRRHHTLMLKTLANLFLKILIRRNNFFLANGFKGSHIKPFESQSRSIKEVYKRFSLFEYS